MNIETVKLTKTTRLSRWRSYFWPFLAFVIPITLIWIAFARAEIYPFGDRNALKSDAWHQYYPFLVDLQSKLKSGDSLLYTWNNGMGTNFVALGAYYFASPLNLLLLLFPTESLRLVFTSFITAKIGAAGLFCAIALRGAFRRCDVSETVFGCCYALCAFFLGYYWNIMWLDTVALLPLVALGTLNIVRDGRYRLYVAALALSLICNFLMGLYVCIFTFFTFFVLCICFKTNGSLFKKRLLMIAGSTVLAFALTAFILLPTLMALSDTARANSSFPSWRLRESFLDVFGNFAAFIPPTILSGLPNLYCGLPCILLLGLYFTSRRIPLRQKLCTLFMLALIIVCMNVRPLEYIWNAFNTTNSLTFRFSFLVSFVLIVVGAQTIPEILSLTRRQALGMIVISAAALVVFGLCHGATTTMANAIAMMAYICVILAFSAKFFSKRVLAVLLSLVACGELAANTILAVDSMSFISVNNYPNKGEEISDLLEHIAETDDGFYRVESVPWQTLNDPSLVGYRGISSFSSLANANVTGLLEKLGMGGAVGSNRYFYANIFTAPLNSLLGLKYIITKSGEAADSEYLSLMAKSGDVSAYLNEAYLPIGFMTAPSMPTALPEDENPFVVQNAMFSAATGNEADVFGLVDIIHVGHKNLYVTRSDLGNYTYSLEDSEAGGTMKYNYEMPDSGLLYMYLDCDDAETVTIKCGDKSTRYTFSGRSYALCVGWYEAGELVSATWDVEAGIKDKSKMEIYMATLDESVFDAGMARLSDEVLQVDSYSSTSVTGTIDVKESGYFYTSIPYEPGWTLYLDGEKTDITPYQNAFIGLENMEPGVHRIELKYMPAGLIHGLVISGVGLLLFAFLCWYSGISGQKWRAARSAKRKELPDGEQDTEDAQELLSTQKS